MKRILRRILCLLIVFGLTAAPAPQTAYADEYNGLEYTLAGNEATIIGHTTEPSGDVEIPPILGGCPVTGIGANAFQNCNSLTSVTIPDSVTSIGAGAFQTCVHLESVTIPNSVTSIGANAFQNCSRLTSVTIPASVTSISNRVFSGCSKLTSVTIPNSVTSIGEYAFYQCALTSLTIPNSVTSIGNYAFISCDFTSVVIPESITNIGEQVFASCTSLMSVTIPESVTRIGPQAFQSCKSLTSVTIPTSVTSIRDYAFYQCSSLNEINYAGTATEWDTLVNKGTNWNMDCPSDMEIRYGAYDVKIIPGGSMAHDATSGDLSQRVKANETMKYVIFTADEGYYFPADYAVPALEQGFHLDRSSDGSQITVEGLPTKDTTITLPDASEKPAATFTVRFNKNGGTGTMNEETREAGEYTLPVCLFTPPEGKVFDCWVVEGIEYDKGDSITVSADTTVTAQWKEKEKTTLTITPGAGMTKTDDSGELSQTVYNGDKIDDVVFTADNGYYFPKDYKVDAVNGISVTWDSDSQITVAGTLTTGAAITLSDAMRKSFTITFVDEERAEKQFPFTDVPEDAYFYKAVLWAYENGIVAGISPTTFSPYETATRAQMITFVWAASGAPEPETAENPFEDIAETDYFYKAVLWAYENGITSGVSADLFGPDQTVTRGQAATFLYNAAGRPEAGEEPFGDVNDGDYFQAAVAWAFENGITNGTSATAFSPDEPCLRCQIVTFLYLHFAE